MGKDIEEPFVASAGYLRIPLEAFGPLNIPRRRSGDYAVVPIARVREFIEDLRNIARRLERQYPSDRV